MVERAAWRRRRSISSRKWVKEELKAVQAFYRAEYQGTKNWQERMKNN